MSSRRLPTRSLGRAVAERLSSLRRDERGAVIVIVAVSMVAFLGMLAVAIDLGGWYQTHRHAQGTADAAALAAANYIANGTGTVVSNEPAATNIAIAYASNNGLTITSSNVSYTTTTVSVTVPTTAPSYFAHVVGIGSQSVSATAVASWNITSTACATPGNTCYAIFASDTSCASGSSTAAISFNGAGDTITGGVNSNGSIYLQGGGNQHLGPTTYGTGTGCTATPGNGSGDTFTSGPTAQAPTTTWPEDYSTILTACGGTGKVACTGPGGTPAYCTKAQASYTFSSDTLTTDNVYCAYGTGTPSTPTTWNGLIEFEYGGLGSASTPILGTWIAGTIDVDHQSYLAPQTTTPTYPLFYAVGSGTCSSATVGGVCMTASSSQVSGAIFAPNGTIEFNGAGSTANFLESKDVNLLGGAFSGSGPLLSGGGSGSSSGSDALTG
jgi:Flp pilus assembly protein TadG